jgi:hypothetical protein
LFKPCLFGDLILPEILVSLQMPNIGYVPYIANPVTEMFQVTENKIESNRRTGVSEMGISINCRTTNIHTDRRGMEWFKGLFFPGKGVINAKLHVTCLL